MARYLSFGSRTVVAAVSVVMAFGCMKPAEEKIVNPAVAALAASASCASASPDNTMVVVEHRTSATSGYMFMNGQTIEARPGMGTPNVTVSISSAGGSGTQKRFTVNYSDQSGKTSPAEARVPECD